MPAAADPRVAPSGAPPAPGLGPVCRDALDLVPAAERHWVTAARRLGADLLAPHAAASDAAPPAGGVDRGTVAALQAAGLLALGQPDQPVSAATARAVTEVLAAADLATWFVVVQHALPLGAALAAPAPVRARLVPALTGPALAAIAIAHLRRPGAPAVTATRVPGGWRLDGRVGWLTSWGLADVVVCGALSADDEVLLVVLPGSPLSSRPQPDPGLRASAPLPLTVMAGTATVAVDLDGVLVGDDDVVERTPGAAWRAADATKTVNASAHHFGFLDAVLGELSAAPLGDAEAAELAAAFSARARALRAEAYHLLDAAPAGTAQPERLRLRGETLLLAQQAATALVTASGGSALTRDAVGQRRVREAAFLTVQAQTGAVRAATLRASLPAPPAGRPPLRAVGSR